MGVALPDPKLFARNTGSAQIIPIMEAINALLADKKLQNETKTGDRNPQRNGIKFAAKGKEGLAFFYRDSKLHLQVYVYDAGLVMMLVWAYNRVLHAAFLDEDYVLFEVMQ